MLCTVVQNVIHVKEEGWSLVCMATVQYDRDTHCNTDCSMCCGKRGHHHVGQLLHLRTIVITVITTYITTTKIVLLWVTMITTQQ